MKNKLKNNNIVRKSYGFLQEFSKAYFPRLRAEFAYVIAYGEKSNLKNPKTFSEKLLWLSLNTYRNNPLVLNLSDKYLVREYVKDKVGEEILNDLYYVWESSDEIDYKKLPNSFSLKVSQGCKTNVFCKDKAKFSRNDFNNKIEELESGQFLYDKMMANVGGIKLKNLKKYFICEKFLIQSGHNTPVDYKIYCFNGKPKAILVVGDRFDNKVGEFMTTDWKHLSKLKGNYRQSENNFDKPESLEEMLEIAKKLSEPFPFVRVDLYDINGKPVFGEMTFFPNGCINMQETNIDGLSMGQHLDINKELQTQSTNL